MNQAIATQMLGTYGLPTNQHAQFGPFADPTGVYLDANRASFPFVNSVQQLRELASFINPGHAFGFPKATLLRNVNQISGATLHTIPNNNPIVVNNVLATGLDTIVQTWSNPEKVQFGDFVKAKMRAAPAQHAAKLVADVVEITQVGGLNRAHLLSMFDLVRANGDRGTTNVRPTNAAALIRMFLAFPNQRFPGFTRWGPGDSDPPNAATNLENHFKKHVCDSSGQFPTESAWWWRALEVKVKQADLLAPVSLAEAAYFTGPGGTQDPRRLSDFITNVVRPRQALIDALYAAYGPAYAAYALTLTTQLSEIMVEAANEKVMISGYSGHVTIFGRYDDAADPTSQLGISSCYFVIQTQRGAKINPNKPNKLWAMTR